MVYPHKWSPVSCRSSAGQRKFASQRLTFYHCATQPTVFAGYTHYSLQQKQYIFTMSRCLTHAWSAWQAGWSSSCMHIMNHNWSARKQRLHLQSASGISCHSALSEDRIRKCGTSSESRRKDTDQCLQVAISFCRHRSVLVPCENVQ